MERPVVSPSGASSDCAPYGASYNDLWGGSSGGIGLAGGPLSPSGYPSDTLGSPI